MADLSRETKRNRKIARTLIRLKHSLAADDQIDEYLAAEEAALLQGQSLRLDTNEVLEAP